MRRAAAATPRAGRGSRSAASRARRRSGTRSGSATGTSSPSIDVAVHEARRAPCRRGVPERDDVEVAEAGRQLGDGGDAHADVRPCRRPRSRGRHRARGGSRRWGWTSGHQVWEGAGRGWASGSGIVGRYVCGTRRDVRAAALLRRAPAAARVDHEDRRRLVADVLDVVRDGRVPGEVVAGTELVRCGRPGSSASGPTSTTWCSSPWWAWTPVACPGWAVTSRMHTSREVARVDLGRSGAAAGLAVRRPLAGAHDPRRDAESSRSQAGGTSRAPAIAASASSDGHRLLVLDLRRGSRR